jgi:hypothetical protein
MTALDVSSDPIQAISLVLVPRVLRRRCLRPHDFPVDVIVRSTDLADLQRMQGGLM